MNRGNPARRMCFALIAAVLIFGGCKDDKEFAVTFNSKGGSAVASQNIKNGEKATKPADPTRDGYTFEAWYREEALTTVWNSVAISLKVKSVSNAPTKSSMAQIKHWSCITSVKPIDN